MLTRVVILSGEGEPFIGHVGEVESVNPAMTGMRFSTAAAVLIPTSVVRRMVTKVVSCIFDSW